MKFEIPYKNAMKNIYLVIFILLVLNNLNAGTSNLSDEFLSPLDNALQRVTKKSFGIFITIKTSPVKPERFSGYHTGTDFEIYPDELNKDVPVKAVKTGIIIMKKYVRGYGGVVIIKCELDKQPITIIYGHLKLASISAEIGDNIKAGDIIGVLGADKSIETDGERKHLHLGFHKGKNMVLLGYVQKKQELSDWIDPFPYFIKK